MPIKANDQGNLYAEDENGKYIGVPYYDERTKGQFLARQANSIGDAQREIKELKKQIEEIQSVKCSSGETPSLAETLAQQLEDSKDKIILEAIGEEDYDGVSLPIFKTANAVPDVFILELENGKTVGVFKNQGYGVGHVGIPVKKSNDLAIDDESVLKSRTQAIASDIALQSEGRGSILDAGIKMKDPYVEETEEDICEEIEIKYEPTYQYDETLSTNGKRIFLKDHYGIDFLSDQAVENMYSIITTGDLINDYNPAVKVVQENDFGISVKDREGKDIDAEKIDVRHAKVPERELNLTEKYGLAIPRRRRRINEPHRN